MEEKRSVEKRKGKKKNKRRKRRDYIHVHIVVDPEVHELVRSLVRRGVLKELGVENFSHFYELAAELLLYILED